MGNGKDGRYRLGLGDRGGESEQEAVETMSAGGVAS